MVYNGRADDNGGLIMFVRISPRKKKNKTYYYAELVQSYRDAEGKPRHKRILYLGSVDLELAKRLKIAFSKDFNSFTNVNKLEFSSSFSYGNYYLIDILFKRFKMFEYFEKHFVSSDKHIRVRTALEYIKAMIFQRIIKADSKLSLVENHHMSPLKYFLKFEDDYERDKFLDIQSLYRSLEVLENNFSVVEKYLYELATGYFNQNEKELYYDITSSYFEGSKCIIAEFGYSRDKRKDKKQIVIGLVVTANGFPIKCNIYPGNRLDKTTVVEVVRELKREYPIEEVVFVGDRGMISSGNINSIKELGEKFVMAVPRSWSKKYLKGVEIREDKMDKIEDNLYSVVVSNSQGERFLLCLNTEKREDSRSYRKMCINRTKEELDKLIMGLGKNRRIKNRDDAMRKAGAISKLNYTGKYFKIRTEDSDENSLGFTVKYELNKKAIAEDSKLDGTFLIRTNEDKYSEKKLLEVYKNLSKVENAFKIIKNDLYLRPMNHRKESRVKGHVYLCVISYFIMNAIDYISKKAGLNKSSRRIIRELESINLIDIDLPNGEKRHALTRFNDDIKRIMKGFEIKKIAIPKV